MTKKLGRPMKDGAMRARIGIMVRAEIMDAVRAAAKAKGLTVGEYVRGIITQELEEKC